RYYFSVEDRNKDQSVEKTEFIIQERDIYGGKKERVIYNETFDGNEAIIKIVVPGNYRCFARVFDGALWSSWYRAHFTCHVVSESQVLYPDLLESKKRPKLSFSIPSAIYPNEDSFIAEVKREINGLYTLYHKSKNYLGYLRHRYISGSSRDS
ncbi:hypothetical protein ACFLRC_01250, partial [Candidatus Altiarchaeota archaeon]